MAKAKKTDTKQSDTAADIRQLTDDQIQARINDVAKEKLNMRFQKATGQLANPKAGVALRKENARLKTEQSARRNSKTA